MAAAKAPAEVESKAAAKHTEASVGNVSPLEVAIRVKENPTGPMPRIPQAIRSSGSRRLRLQRTSRRIPITRLDTMNATNPMAVQSPMQIPPGVCNRPPEGQT